MEKWGNMNPNIPICQMEFCNGPKGMDRDIFMRQHYPLGAARGAAGVIDLSNVLVCEVGFRDDVRRSLPNATS